MKITLIRHTSVNVPQGICYGQTDVPLNDTFEEEAALVARNLQDERFDKVFVSPLSRCVRLADYCGFADAERDDRIKEIHFGEWEMCRFEDIFNDPKNKDWFNNFVRTTPPGGESFMMQYKRVSAFLDQLNEKEYKHVAVFAHGGVLICAKVYAGKLPLEEAFKEIPPYGGIITIDKH